MVNAKELYCGEKELHAAVEPIQLLTITPYASGEDEKHLTGSSKLYIITKKKFYLFRKTLNKELRS